MQKYFWEVIVKGIPHDGADGNPSHVKLFHHIEKRVDKDSEKNMYILFYEELAAFLKLKEGAVKKRSPLELTVICFCKKRREKKMAEDLRLYLVERLRWWWNPQFELDLSA